MQYVGFAFQPYVGPWQPSPNPVGADAWSSYSQSVVLQLLMWLASQGVKQISTYSNGWAAYGGSLTQSDSNQYILPAASELGLTVVAGANQWVDASQPTGWNLSVTENDILSTLAFVKANPGVVTTLNITNEAIEAGTTVASEAQFAQNILTLVNFAVEQLPNYGLQNVNATASGYLPISIRESAGILNGVNQNQSYSATLRTILQTVNFVYANIYPYGFTYNLGANPSQSDFQTFITSELSRDYQIIQGNFQAQNLSTPIGIGETGWPTDGVNATTNTLPANVQLAQWNYQAVYLWANLNQVQTFVFEAFNESFKTGAPGSPPSLPTYGGSDQGYYGVFVTDGAVPDADFPYNQTNNYVLNQVTQQYNLTGLGPGLLAE